MTFTFLEKKVHIKRSPINTQVLCFIKLAEHCKSKVLPVFLMSIKTKHEVMCPTVGNITSFKKIRHTISKTSFDLWFP